MNWTAIIIIALGLLAFPLCIIGITALAGGMLIAGRLSREEEIRDAQARLQEQNKNDNLKAPPPPSLSCANSGAFMSHPFEPDPAVVRIVGAAERQARKARLWGPARARDLPVNVFTLPPATGRRLILASGEAEELALARDERRRRAAATQRRQGTKPGA